MPNEVLRGWNEFWAELYRIKHRHRIPTIFDWDAKLVEFIETVLELEAGAEILDLACGGGDQAKLLARKGYKVTGIDIAPVLVDFAKGQFADEGLDGAFVVGDMRKIDYSETFDACLILSGSFGFFSDHENQELLISIRRALKPGGKVFIMALSPHRPRDRSRSWLEMSDGWLLSETWFDPETSSYRGSATFITKDGIVVRPGEEEYGANETIRCYSLPELKSMFQKAGLSMTASYGSLELPPQPYEIGSNDYVVTGMRPSK